MTKMKEAVWGVQVILEIEQQNKNFKSGRGRLARDVSEKYAVRVRDGSD